MGRQRRGQPVVVARGARRLLLLARARALRRLARVQAVAVAPGRLARARRKGPLGAHGRRLAVRHPRARLVPRHRRRQQGLDGLRRGRAAGRLEGRAG
eukprot:6444588-Prymnesium_polylepis.1